MLWSFSYCTFYSSLVVLIETGEKGISSLLIHFSASNSDIISSRFVSNQICVVLVIVVRNLWFSKLAYCQLKVFFVNHYCTATVHKRKCKAARSQNTNVKHKKLWEYIIECLRKQGGQKITVTHVLYIMRRYQKLKLYKQWSIIHKADSENDAKGKMSEPIYCLRSW